MATTLKKYAQFGGANPETASLAHVLEYQGILSPLDGKPLSETNAGRCTP